MGKEIFGWIVFLAALYLGLAICRPIVEFKMQIDLYSKQLCRALFLIRTVGPRSGQTRSENLSFA